jgi:starvation-inducible DNA-binding protein
METLIDQLRVILCTNFGLYFKAHAFHWNVTGRNFSIDHKFLGKFYESVFDQTDFIAEKLRMLGVFAPTSLSRIMELCDIQEEVTIPDSVEMFRKLIKDNETFIFHLRAGIVAADNADQPAISNFLQELLDRHQKHAWMLNSIVQ